jgi:hypothetical protein
VYDLLKSAASALSWFAFWHWLVSGWSMLLWWGYFVASVYCWLNRCSYRHWYPKPHSPHPFTTSVEKKSITNMDVQLGLLPLTPIPPVPTSGKTCSNLNVHLGTATLHNILSQSLLLEKKKHYKPGCSVRLATPHSILPSPYLWKKHNKPWCSVRHCYSTPHPSQSLPLRKKNKHYKSGCSVRHCYSTPHPSQSLPLRKKKTLQIWMFS